MAGSGASGTQEARGIGVEAEAGRGTHLRARISPRIPTHHAQVCRHLLDAMNHSQFINIPPPGILPYLNYNADFLLRLQSRDQRESGARDVHRVAPERSRLPAMGTVGRAGGRPAGRLPPRPRERARPPGAPQPSATQSASRRAHRHHERHSEC